MPGTANINWRSLWLWGGELSLSVSLVGTLQEWAAGLQSGGGQCSCGMRAPCSRKSFLGWVLGAWDPVLAPSLLQARLVLVLAAAWMSFTLRLIPGSTGSPADCRSPEVAQTLVT